MMTNSQTDIDIEGTLSTFLHQKLESRIGEGKIDEALTTYIAGLITDDTLSSSEKKETVIEFLSASLAEVEPDSENSNEINETELEKLYDIVVNRYGEVMSEIERNQEVQKKLEIEKAKEQEQSIFNQHSVPNSLLDSSKETQNNGGRSKLKEQIIQKYGSGYDEMSIVQRGDGEEEVVYFESNRQESLDDPLFQNTSAQNRRVVSDQESQRREHLRTKNAQQKQREAELLEKQKLAKEKEKRRTMKKEKRRM
ncbi:hypothetical protein BKA69DRAFT_1101581 [Paraphysoderma sedebokerense]|nr:hypothetical protein BKA69DRAFT_1101581 [Paraphysoderma sedebokerense]